VDEKREKVTKSKRWGSEWTREQQRRKGGTPSPRGVAEFPTFKGSWPCHWPWIGSYCISSCIGWADIWDPLY